MEPIEVFVASRKAMAISFPNASLKIRKEDWTILLNVQKLWRMHLETLTKEHKQKPDEVWEPSFIILETGWSSDGKRKF